MLDLIPRWVLLTVIGALSVAWGWRGIQLADARGDVAKAKSQVAELREAIAVANTEAANKAAALQSAVTKAQNEATKREATMRAAYSAAVSESDGLRDDAANLRHQLAGATAAASAERAATVAAILADCGREYQRLAQKADRHASDARTLMEAWPR